jgi:hypothetical protein
MSMDSSSADFRNAFYIKCVPTIDNVQRNIGTIKPVTDTQDSSTKLQRWGLNGEELILHTGNEWKVKHNDCNT